MHDNREIARRYIEEVWSRGNVGAIAELVTADYHGMTRAAGQKRAEGPAGLARWVSGLFATFSDVKKEVTALIVEGDEVAAEVAFSALHRASGKRIAADQLYRLRLRDGRVAQESIFFDTGGVLAELGTPPACALR